jgi:ABC-2 type transport system permease protein
MNKLLASKFWWLYVLAGLLGINYIASLLHYRFDLTQERRYTISNTTKNLVRQINDQAMITVFLTGDMPAGFKKLANSTNDFLRILKEYNSADIKYSFKDPEEEMPGTGRRYMDTLQSLGAVPINLTVQVKSGQQNKLVYPVALIEYNNQVKLVNLYSGGKRVITPEEMNSAEAMMEYHFAKAIDELSSPVKPLVGYATGNDEPIDATSYDMQQTLQKNYQLFMFNLNNQPNIPDTFKVFFIVKPALTFTDAEKLKIDQYIMRGGKVLFFIDQLQAEQDSLQYKTRAVAFDRDLNLTDLLFKYGVRINPDLVMDLQCDFLRFAVGGNQDNPQFEFLQWNYYPLFETPNNHPINRNLGLVAGRFVNSIDTIKNGIKKTVLLSSSPNSRILGTPVMISLNENRNTPQDELFKSSHIPVAVLLEGKFTSLYRNRLSAAQLDSLKSGGSPFKESSNENGKMIVVSDGDMILNDVSQKYGPLPMGMNLATIQSQYEYQFANKDFLLNCLEYLTDKPGIIEIRNKDIILRLLDKEKVDEQRTTWQIITIGGPVLLVLIFGFIYQALRKKKYQG